MGGVNHMHLPRWFKILWPGLLIVAAVVGSITGASTNSNVGVVTNASVNTVVTTIDMIAPAPCRGMGLTSIRAGAAPNAALYATCNFSVSIATEVRTTEFEDAK